MANNSQKKSVTTEPEIGSNGIGHSDAQGGGGVASPAELSLALEKVLARNAQLEKQLAEANANKGSGDIKELASVLTQMMSKQAAPAIPQEADNINRTSDFKGTKATVDGRSLMEAQQTLQMFRNEPKYPISISKTIANSVGPSLTITVNGVRISIPCDGKTYMINESHYEHARERLAKLDILTANTEPQVIEIG